MPCLHKFPVFASMCLTGFILCVGLCVFFGNVCVRCEFNWLRCAVFLLKAHTTMGCVSESRLGKCLQRQRGRQSNVTKCRPNSLQRLGSPVSTSPAGCPLHNIGFVVNQIFLNCWKSAAAAALNWPIPGLVIHPRLTCHLFEAPSHSIFGLTTFSKWQLYLFQYS